LVGPNGCGKSSVIDAISLVFGRTKMVRLLTEHDFAGSDPSAAARIKIVATLAGFASDDPEEHVEWFRADRAIPKWLGVDGREYAEGGTGRKLCVNVGYCARFDRDELEVVSVRYFHDDDEFREQPAALLPLLKRNAAAGVFVEQRDDWVETMTASQ
jgi:hypothetical protein